MAKILAKGESVYECDICKRRTRVPTNRVGIDIVQRCIVTSNCQGKLHRIILTKDINTTPAFPPEVAGAQDWFQRKVLHTHEQPVQSSKWIVNHGLANKPNLYVYIQRYINGVIATVETKDFVSKVVDLNTVEILFDQAEQGRVQCITSASQNSTNPVATAGVAASSTAVQLTTNGEFSIATLTDASNINLTLTFNSPSSPTPVIIQYLNVSVPSVKSPWGGSDAVIVNGKRYTIRSFNLVTTQLAPPYFSSGAIADGSTIVVTGTYKVGEAIMLLSTSPHTAADRVYDKYIDVATLQQESKLSLFDGVVYADPTVVKNTYPPIIVV